MTENQWPQDEDLTNPPATQNSGYGAGTTGYGATGAGTTGYTGSPVYQDDASSRKDVAKDEAANVAGETKVAAQNVAGTAKTEAKNVAYEAKNSAKDLLHQAKSDLTSQAGTQQTKAAEGIRSVSSQLRSMADAPDQQGVASDLIRQAADRSESVASWLDNRDPGSLLDEVKSFARQRPRHLPAPRRRRGHACRPPGPKPSGRRPRDGNRRRIRGHSSALPRPAAGH
jgi:hypothetical protein